MIRSIRALAFAALASASLAACATGPVGAQRIYTAGAETVDAEDVSLPARWFLFVEAETPRSDGEIRRAIASATDIVDRKAQQDGISSFGPPIVDRLRPQGTNRVAFRVGRFVRAEPKEPLIGVRVVRFEASEAMRFSKSGAFDSSPGARRAIAQYVSSKGRLPVGAPFLEVTPGPKHAIVQPVAGAPGS